MKAGKEEQEEQRGRSGGAEEGLSRRLHQTLVRRVMNPPPPPLLLLPSNRSLAASRRGTSTHALTRATYRLRRRPAAQKKSRNDKEAAGVSAARSMSQQSTRRDAPTPGGTHREQSLQSETAAQQVGRLQVVVSFVSSLPPSPPHPSVDTIL